ncbi:MAG: SpoIIE family protein phosphatase [Rhodospirillales bacterium]|nr:SpoIIE family protein phosphatase [Rhodospirillales bacterium]
MPDASPQASALESTQKSIAFDQLELLAEMSRDFASSRDMQASLEKAVAHITEYIQADGGALFMLNAAGDKLICEASVGATEIKGLTLPSDQGIVGRSVQNHSAEIVRDVQNDPNFYNKVDEKTGFTTRSIICAPLRVKDERIGAIELINKRSADGLFSEDDLRLLETMSASAGLAIHNARQADALVEQEVLARELELAAEIQRSLLPEERGDEFPVHGVNIPARTVSGDFFDFFELDDGRVCFNLGDVSGKGMNAALLMAKTASLFRCLGKTIHQPGRLMALINKEVCETAARGMFVTMVGGIYDPRSGIVRIANAGHEPPLFFSESGDCTAFEAEAPPLGITTFLADGDRYPENEFQLAGGSFYIFTDGVTEGYQADGSELEVAGLINILKAGKEKTAAARLADVVRVILGGERAIRDDTTLLCLEDRARLPAGSGPATGIFAEDAAGDLGVEILNLEVPSQPDRLKLVRNAIAQAALFTDCSDETAQDVVIAVDEALQNVIRHAYSNQPDGKIKVTVSRTTENLIILIRDYAETINIETVQPRDLDDIRPGGLGTHFMREVMDEVSFLPPPDGQGNLLKLVKRIA